MWNDRNANAPLDIKKDSAEMNIRKYVVNERETVEGELHRQLGLINPGFATRRSFLDYSPMPIMWTEKEDLVNRNYGKYSVSGPEQRRAYVDQVT